MDLFLLRLFNYYLIDLKNNMVMVNFYGDDSIQEKKYKIELVTKDQIVTEKKKNVTIEIVLNDQVLLLLEEPEVTPTLFLESRRHLSR